MDQYWYAYDGLKTPFPNVLWDWLNHIKAHIALMKHVEIHCRPIYNAQRMDEIIAALTDSGFDFKAGTLRVWVKEEKKK